jgi:hypothetical protein
VRGRAARRWSCAGEHRAAHLPDVARDESARLSYPRWEREYRLKLVRELAEHEYAVVDLHSRDVEFAEHATAAA